MQTNNTVQNNADYTGWSAYLIDHLQQTFKESTQDALTLFFTNVQGLWDTFLSSLSGEDRQHFNCHACKTFIRRHGALTTVNADGSLNSVMWNEEGYDGPFKDAIRAMRLAVENSRVEGAFYSDAKFYGVSRSGDWRHLHVRVSPSKVFCNKTLTPGQFAARKQQEVKMLRMALSHYDSGTIKTAITLFEQGVLNGKESFVPRLEWLLSLKEEFDKKDSVKSKNVRLNNLLWLNVANAPPGWAHVRSGVIGTLLQGITEGASTESICASFNEKTKSTVYQRPTSAPPKGNVQVAEDLVKKLGIERSLDRRFARLDEVKLLWSPVVEDKIQQEQEGVFSHLLAENAPQKTLDDLPSQKLTWRKFAETVLSKALAIKVVLPPNRPDYFAAVLTATHDDAPPILKYDLVGARNPFSVYTYSEDGGEGPGRIPSEWNIQTREVEVTGIGLRPNMWGEQQFPQFGEGVLFYLKGCIDLEAESIALFPNLLINELHPVRATIEAFSATRKPAGVAEASACGLLRDAQGPWDLTLQVTMEGVDRYYLIDRFD